jgi:glycyl-tRNA synthetase beta chain
MPSELLLELGCEEIPSGWFFPPAELGASLRKGLQALLEQERLLAGDLEVFTTPRRLVARAAVHAAQAPRTVTSWGPPSSAARDASGAWTKAARGFAAKLKVEPEELSERPKDPAKPKELYLAHDRREEGRPGQDVLPGVLASLLRGLPFPKRMSWDAWLEDGRGSLPFGRPIRWIVALLDGAPVPFTIYQQEGDGRGAPWVESGRASRGHRFLPRGAGGAPFPVATFAELKAGLKERFVLLDRADRLARIQQALRASAPEAADHPLVAEWSELVEHPSVVFGRIPTEFRSLPSEVLETVLVHHQRYIPLASEGRFAAVTDTDGTTSAEIVRGLEAVVVARLRDAAFFFEEDMKRPLSDRVPDLKGITFQQGLGTYLEKSDRLVALVDEMGSRMGILTKPEHQAAREAARLAKADLTTLMVREFPELQGIMGGIYLKAQGTPWENVALAVRFQYQPTSVEEGSPPAPALGGGDATVFGAVALADKLDTLAGSFGLGLEPTGSSDPLGLRRAAQGVVRILLDFWSTSGAETRPDLGRLSAAALAGYGNRFKRPAEETLRSLGAFLRDRLAYVLQARGFPTEEVLAVLDSPGVDPLKDPYDAQVRVRSLHLVRETAREDFEHLATAFKRAKNIVEQGTPGAVDPSRFEEAEEGALHEAVGKLSRDGGSYEDRLRGLAGLRGPVDRFFDKVLVMAKDDAVRRNRLSLLYETLSLFYRIADISRLGG